VHPDGVRDAMTAAALERCCGEQFVFVPIDGSSLGVTDETGKKDIGGIGAWSKGGRGVQTMTALAVTTSGAPLGVCGQRMWVREQPATLGKPAHQRQFEGESRFWLELLASTHREFCESAPACRPWFQMDRGADCWPIFLLACELDALVTVRAVHNRRADDGRKLWSILERAPVITRRRIDVPARPPARKRKRIDGERVHYWATARGARVATTAIRAATVSLECTTPKGRTVTIKVNAVFVREERRREDRLEWMLLTTHPVQTRRDVLEVVRGYELRWRIEDFHRAWKRGLCRVEDTQLRSRNAIFKWATILAAVATRAMRLTYLARETPDVLASTEFSPTEIEAVIALRDPKSVPDIVTLGIVVRWLADIGGYTGPWNGPPGPTVVGRGLQDALVAARAFERRDKMR
jgi:hypothetical protein